MATDREYSATFGSSLTTLDARDSAELQNQSFVPSDVILPILYAVIGTIGLLGNGFVVVVIVNFRSMLKAVPNLFIINQSLIDASASLILILIFQIPVDGNNLKGGFSADLMCKLWISQSVLWCLMASSIYNLALVSLERYACVVHPIWHRNQVTRRRALRLMPFIWFSGFLVDWPFTLPSTKVIDGQCYISWFWPNDSVRRFMGMYLVIFLFIVPLAVFIFCYTSIANALRSKVTPQGNAPEQSGSDRNAQESSDMKSRARMNVLKTLAVVVGLTVVTWGVSETYFALYNLGLDYPYIDFTSPAAHFTIFMTYLNCCINPFVYASQYQKFKEGVRVLFGMERPQNPDVSETGETPA